MNFEHAGLKLSAQGQTDRASVYTLSDGGTLAIPNLPAANGVAYRESQLAAEAVLRALKPFAALDQVRRDVMADKNLSEVGRAKAAEAAQAAAKTGLRAAEEEVELLGRQVTALTAEVFSPPTIDRADAVEGLVDLEIRNHLRSLPDSAKSEALAEVARNPRLQDAVLRSPLPIPPFTEIAAARWKELQAISHPKARELDRLTEAVAWARIVLPAVARRI